jgi:hypothetical protein
MAEAPERLAVHPANDECQNGTGLNVRLLVHPWCVGNADNGSFDRDETSNGLAPSFGTRTMKQHISLIREFAGRCGDPVDVLDLELNASLRDRPVRWPFACSKAGFSGLSERPHTKVLTAADAFAEEIFVALVPLQRQAQRVHEELPAARRIGCDDGDAGNELDLHETLR